MTIYRDEATGREYGVRPDGTAYWLPERPEAVAREVLEPFPEPAPADQEWLRTESSRRARPGRRSGAALVAVAVAVLAAAGGFVGGRVTAPSADEATVAAVRAAGDTDAGDVKPAKAKPDPEVCRSKASAAMAVALVRDGNFDSLPKTKDRSLGIAECKGLTKKQLDDIAAQLQVDLAPFILAAAAEQASKP